MVKTIFFENLFNNMLRHTSLIVSQIATAIFLPPALSGLYLIKFLLIQRLIEVPYGKNAFKPKDQSHYYYY